MLFGKKDEKPWKGQRKGKLLTVQISTELYSELETVSRKYGVTKSQLIRDALMEKIARLREQK